MQVRRSEKGKSHSKPYRFVQRTALLTARTIDVRIVRVNVTATVAAKDAIVSWARAKSPLAPFRINSEK